MITVRTRRKLGMGQLQLHGAQEEGFIITLGQNFLDFVDKYSEFENYDSSTLYIKMKEFVDNKDVEGIKDLFQSLQVFGTYDKVTDLTTKYKNISTACGLTFNGTVYEGRADEQKELDRIVSHTCTLCSVEGEEYVEKLFA